MNYNADGLSAQLFSNRDHTGVIVIRKPQFLFENVLISVEVLNWTIKKRILKKIHPHENTSTL